MVRYPARAIAGVVVVVLAGCGTLLGFEEARDLDAPSVDADGGLVGFDIVPSTDTPGVVCVPRAPEGWQGPLALYEARGATSAAPACAASFRLVYDGNGDLDAPPATCSCTCDPGKGYACGPARSAFYGDDKCTTECQAARPIPVVANDLCPLFDDGACPAARWIKFTPGAVLGPACQPKAKAGTPPPPTWKVDVRLCGPTPDLAARCPGERVPTPRAELPFTPENYCVASRTDTTCPASYPSKRTYFDPDKAEDTRGCDTCSCGPPTGTCGGTVTTVDTAAGCSGGARVANAGTCVSVKDSNKGWGYAPGAPSGVTCEPVGGGPKGELRPTAPITVCCRR